ncbi:MAG: hypothetical protein DME05_23360 [Candidatus Rokuibacteriota bacterium]|nr:MAG: hypothetical protein DME05_23360 [Candidatus Rokubacteria bacterium]
MLDGAQMRGRRCRGTAAALQSHADSADAHLDLREPELRQEDAEPPRELHGAALALPVAPPSGRHQPATATRPR